MPSEKRWHFKKNFTANGSCGSGKAIDVIQPKSKTKSKAASDDDNHDRENRYCGFSATAPEDRDRDGDANCSQPVSKIHNSLAVVKVSDDPYRDFRQSMVQMILENEIYSRDDLQELLRCFLELNSPHHHEVIVKAFMEIGIAERPPPSLPPCSSASAT